MIGLISIHKKHESKDKVVYDFFPFFLDHPADPLYVRMPAGRSHVLRLMFHVSRLIFLHQFLHIALQ